MKITSIVPPIFLNALKFVFIWILRFPLRKHLKKRKKVISKLNNESIMEEFKEWSNDPIPEIESIWTLPDLTSSDRLRNFCRSIKKEIS